MPMSVPALVSPDPSQLSVIHTYAIQKCTPIFYFPGHLSLVDRLDVGVAGRRRYLKLVAVFLQRRVNWNPITERKLRVNPTFKPILRKLRKVLSTVDMVAGVECGRGAHTSDHETSRYAAKMYNRNRLASFWFLDFAEVCENLHLQTHHDNTEHCEGPSLPLLLLQQCRPLARSNFAAFAEIFYDWCNTKPFPNTAIPGFDACNYNNGSG